MADVKCVPILVDIWEVRCSVALEAASSASEHPSVCQPVEGVDKFKRFLSGSILPGEQNCVAWPFKYNNLTSAPKGVQQQ